MTNSPKNVLENSADAILSVSEVSYALKNVVENSFAHLQIRGEISGGKLHTSGHFYFALKDNAAVLDAICWRGVMARIGFLPQDGMDVICTGHLTTYPGRSKYQVVVERIDLAGEGALLKMLEDRKRLLAAEGLFDLDRKKSLPFMPRCIGIITSATGAVIQDMLHRLQDRFPCPVILWPVLVQGEGAAEQIARAIQGFNALPFDGNILKPDLLIVARGGGSLEDLWAFNEEIVVRAAAASEIPLISGVGHEPDITLIDFAADHRAPTPSAAAEKAVPVRREIQNSLESISMRLNRGLLRIVEDNTFRLEDRLERLQRSPQLFLERWQQNLILLKQRLRHPVEIIDQYQMQINSLEQRLDHHLQRLMDHVMHRFERVTVLLKSYSFEATLARGFALIKTGRGQILTSFKDCTSQMKVQINFQDGAVDALINPTKIVSRHSKTPGNTHPKLWEV